MTPEERFRNEPVSNSDPEKEYDRKWVLALMEAAVEHLREEWVAAGKKEQFEALKEFLADRAFGDYARIGEQLGLKPDSVASAVSRLRQRYRELLREEVAKTVPPDQIDQELRSLKTAFQ
jgi:RNA polymerase sigma-70 factor (ECF subfamily)